MFSGHAEGYQALSARAAAFHDEFVRTLNAAASSYAGAEAANGGPLQAALKVVNAPAMAVMGRPLIGNGGNIGIGGAAGPANGINGSGGLIGRDGVTPN